MSGLFQATRLGALDLNNRIVMAPMTRSRATPDGAPTPIMADYYAQRASAGLVISEGVYPSEDGKGYCRTPGIVSEDDVAGWRAVTHAVHARGGTFVMQIMHCGRCSHADNKSADAETVAPSAIPVEGKIYTEDGMKPFSPARALATEEIPRIVEEYAEATWKAFAAGCDGVELHAASGYLPAQFLSPGSNQRRDAYGGSLNNRLRFVVETLEAMSAVKGAARVGLRICPGFAFNDVKDPDPQETFEGLLAAIAHLDLAYLHVMRASTIDVIALARDRFAGPFIVNGGYTKEKAEKAIAEKGAAAVSFATAFIANPDLPARLQKGAPLAEADQATIYAGGAKGYADYPSLEA